MAFAAGATFNGGFDLHGNTSMTTLTVTNATFSQNMECNGCTLLATVNLGTATFTNGSFADMGMNGCALLVGDSTHGVDGLLHRCVVSGLTGASGDLSVGTSASPSNPAGLADKATLNGTGNVFLTN